MANTYVSKPVYLASGLVTGYTCPTAKRALIKSINVNNETNQSGVVSVLWQDNNAVGIGSTSSTYPVFISGAVPGYNKIRTIDDFLVIKAGDRILFRTTNVTQLSAVLSIVEQDV